MTELTSDTNSFHAHPYPTHSKTIVVAGATGDLGRRIVGYLIDQGAIVKALVRNGTDANLVATWKGKAVIVAEVDFNNSVQLTKEISGAHCVVSALNGLEPVILGVQTQLLEAAIAAGVPRFIPSDYCIDYTKLPAGSNRNLDLRRRFHDRINQTSIAATSVLNGMFADLLTGQAPVVLFGLKRVLYWGNAEQLLDFTTIENTAAFTAHAAMDNATPRYLRIAGDVLNVNGLAGAAGAATGHTFRPLRAGGTGLLKTMIKITRTLMPTTTEVFPPWQGMQYLHNMFSGLPKLEPLDNARYTGIEWTTVQEVLATRKTP